MAFLSQSWTAVIIPIFRKISVFSNLISMTTRLSRWSATSFLLARKTRSGSKPTESLNLVNSILKPLLQPVAAEIQHKIIRYECSDADEGRCAFAQADSEHGEKHGDQYDKWYKIG